LGIVLLVFGGVILLAGCGLTGYIVALFDTSVPVYPDVEQHGYRSPRVHNLGLMHQQTVWTIVGISVIVIGLALAIVGAVWAGKETVSGPHVRADTSGIGKIAELQKAQDTPQRHAGGH
jgi:hypothetical protein